MIASQGAVRALTHGRLSHRLWPSLALALVVAAALLSGCTPHRGPLTSLGQVDQYPPAMWSPNPAANQVRVGQGIYLVPAHHLILVHIQIPDTSLNSLGPGALHGAVGVWWVALDDRVPHDASPAWLPSCVQFKTPNQGAAFDVVGDYLTGPASASLSRYPLSINPDDNPISVALSAEDTISVPRSGGDNPAPYLPPAPGTPCSSA